MALATKNDPLFDNFAHLKTFPDHLLRDIARNDCADHDYRKHAVEILVVRKSPLVKHPDLQPFVHELNVELDGIQFEYPDPGPGPLVAGVTTETMFAGDTVDLGQETETIPDSLDILPSDLTRAPQPDDPHEVVPKPKKANTPSKTKEISPDVAK